MGRRRKTVRRTPRGMGTVFWSASRRAWIARGPGGTPERWGATQKEALDKLAAAKPPGPDATVSQWAERWLEGLSVKPGTLRSYKRSLVHIRTHLGDVRIADVTPTRVESFAAKLGKDLHPNTVRKVLDELHNLLGGAVRDGVIPSNPVSLARKPKRVKKEIDPFTPEELARIIAACDTQAKAPIALLAASGCRVGEALGLDLPDFDRAAETVSITKTFDHDVGMGTPKSANSVRTISVPAAVPGILLAIGSRRSGPVFVTAEGERRIYDLVRQAWERLLKRLGMRFRNLHQLRHSVATAMVADGVPLANIAEYLGDSVQMIVATYVHPVRGVDPGRAMARILGSIGGREVGGGGGRRKKP